MTPDNELLQRYTEQNDEAAFTELVKRHLNLVYACALRVLNNDAILAQDVTQAVFTDLARKAATLQNHPTLAGWLHTSARFAASKAVRTEQTRRTREQEAAAMNDTATSNDINQTELHPILDEVIGELREGERDALLLRYFEDKSHREIGDVLGVSEGAAQMRVERALDKLRDKFSRRGVATTAALLASALGAHGATMAMPRVLAETVSAESIASATLLPPGEATTAVTGKLALVRFWALTALLFIMAGIFIFRQTATKSPPEPILPIADRQVEPPQSTPATTPAASLTDTEATQNLGEVHLVVDRSKYTPGPNVLGPATFTLKSGLTFSIQFTTNNENGSITVKYGAFEANKPHWRLTAPFDFQPPAISELNEDYQISVTTGHPVMLSLENGEAVKFTPIFTPIKFTYSHLGLITLTVGNPLKFTLSSGKIFRIERINQVNLPTNLPPGFNASDLIGEVKYSIYASEQAYEAGHAGGSGGYAIRQREQRREMKEHIGDNEIVTYTPNYPMNETAAQK